MYRRCNPKISVDARGHAAGVAHHRAEHTVRHQLRIAGRSRGVTLLELIIAVSITAAIAVALGGLLRATEGAFQYAQSTGATTQHARVVFQRICRTVREATANEQFPGFLVVAEQVGEWSFPDTLVVWHPHDSPADPTGLPRFDELVIYYPNPQRPNELLEVTIPDDSRTVPPPANTAAWIAALRQIKESDQVRRIVLTDLIRTATVPESSRSTIRGVVRFEQRLRPSDDQWRQYQEGSLAWEDLLWVQDIYGAHTGLRQAWLRVELQLVAPTTVMNSESEVLPFFASAAIYYPMYRSSS